MAFGQTIVPGTMSYGVAIGYGEERPLAKGYGEEALSLSCLVVANTPGADASGLAL